MLGRLFRGRIAYCFQLPKKYIICEKTLGSWKETIVVLATAPYEVTEN